MCDIEIYNERQERELEQDLKDLGFSADCTLELEYMKQEWRVIANQQVAVNLTETVYTPPVVPREPPGPIVD